jgi:hypothetical protein
MTDDTIRGRTLAAAGRAVLTDRNNEYGGPEQSFGTIAALWSVILGRPVTPAEVALCMASVKIARLTANPTHADSWIDLAGYAACGAEVSGSGGLESAPTDRGGRP